MTGCGWHAIVGGMSDLPGTVRAARQAKGLTIEGLAFAAGVAVRTVSRTESGEHTPSLDTLTAIASALGTTAADLLAGPVEASPKGATA